MKSEVWRRGDGDTNYTDPNVSVMTIVSGRLVRYSANYGENGRTAALWFLFSLGDIAQEQIKGISKINGYALTKSKLD